MKDILLISKNLLQTYKQLNYLKFHSYSKLRACQ